MVLCFFVVEFRPIRPQIVRHQGVVDDAVETRVKICWFRWFCQYLIQGVKDGALIAREMADWQVSNNPTSRGWEVVWQVGQGYIVAGVQSKTF